MFKKSFLFSLLLLGASALLPLSALAAPTLSISSPRADGVFVLRGEGFEGVEALEVRVSYDAGTLSNPRVVTGSMVNGWLAAVNPVNPIVIGMVGTTPLRGSGILATITFDRTGASPGKITALSGSGGSSTGMKIAMAPVITNPAAPSTSSPSGSTGTASAGSGTDNGADTTSARPFVLGGTVTLPSGGTAGEGAKDSPAEAAQQEVPSQEAEQRRHATAKSAAAPPAAEEQDEPEAALGTGDQAPLAEQAPAPQPVASVLEQFRLFQGEKTPANLAALFRSGSDAYSQVPAIGIADGKATVRVVISKTGGDKAPNFAFNSARFVSLARGGDGKWELELRPEKDAVESSVTMLLNGVLQELPLTVAPRAEVAAKKSGEISEAVFANFLRQRGTAAAPKFDLNRDGRRDYIDDYIFTANYLVKMEEKGNKPKESQKKPAAKTP